MSTRAMIALLLAAPYFSGCSDAASLPQAPHQEPAGSAGHPGSAGRPGSHSAGAAGIADSDEPGDESPATGSGGRNSGEASGGMAGTGSGPTTGTTRAFFLPTDVPANTAAPRLETDAQGGTHFLYPAFAIGDAFYGYCAAGCAGADDVAVVRLKTQGSVTNAALALDSNGRPRVLLATFTSVYYASCDNGCSDASRWQTTKIIDHGSDHEVTGESLALENGRPRFLMHAYRKFLGAFQKPETFYVSCDGDCHDPADWSVSSISQQLWEGSTLRFDQAGTAHVATVVQVVSEEGSMTKIAGYFECAGACSEETSWHGRGIDYTYEKITADPRVEPSVSLALTRAGAPRVIVLGKDDDGPRISYHECDANCVNDASWAPFMRLTDPNFGAGIDLALDQKDQPRLVFSSGFNIVQAACSQAHCTDEDAEWTFSNIEKASSMKPDEIITWPNCTVSGWLLHSPSLALTAQGAPRVGYQARDISFGTQNPNPTKPTCTAGTDMSFSRVLLQ